MVLAIREQDGYRTAEIIDCEDNESQDIMEISFFKDLYEREKTWGHEIVDDQGYINDEHGHIMYFIVDEINSCNLR